MTAHDYSQFCVPVLQASTGHLTARENTRLRNQETVCGTHAVCIGEHGHLVWVPLDEPIRARTSTGLGQLLRIAKKLKAHYIQFDADAPSLPGVKTYDW